MKIHLAERDPQHHAWAKRGVDKKQMRLRILLSYHYYKNTDLDELFAKYFVEPYPDVFADSGGFSAMTQGVEIKWQEYAQWVKRWSHLLTVYANLDVIGDAEATLANQKRLEDAGLRPLPVFHTGEDWGYLENYVEQYSYIALGGMVPYMTTPKKLIPWIIKAFRIAGDKSVFHGFGATSWEVMSQLPWYSVDSSSWGQGFRFGTIPLFDERKGKFIKVKLGDGKAWAQHAALVRALGFSPADFADRSRNDRAKICAISALSYMKAEQWLRKRWGDIHIPGQEGTPSGLKAHLADAKPQRFGDAIEGGVGVRLHLADTSNGINLGDADKGLKLHLADARGHSGSDLAAAASSGIKTYLVDSPHTPLRDTGAAQTGLRLHLAEHSLDRGGVGDTSKTMEVLHGQGCSHC